MNIQSIQYAMEDTIKIINYPEPFDNWISYLEDEYYLDKPFEYINVRLREDVQ